MKEISDPIPTDLNECFVAIDKIMSRSEKTESEWFKTNEEKNVVATVHHSFGRHLRNEWSLWNKESALHKYFSNMGLWHADDISSVIITSYHRYINGKELDLKNQIDGYLKYWTEYEKENGPVAKN